MRQVISSKRKHAKILNLLFGHTLIGIAIYIAFRIISFILHQIDMPFSVNDFALAGSVIAFTMYGTNMLLRYDSKTTRKPLLNGHHEYQFEKERNWSNR